MLRRIRTPRLGRACLIATLFTFLLPATADAYNVLFATENDGSVTAGEQLRIDLITSWGHTVNLIYDGATQVEFNAAIISADVAYISEESTSNSPGTKLADACIGVVNEAQQTLDELGFATTGSVNDYDHTDIYIPNNSHYITEPFTDLGNHTIFSSIQELLYIDVNKTISPNAEFLAWRPTTSDYGTLVVMEIGAALVGGGTANGRRVMLPWGDKKMTDTGFSTLTADGKTIMRRSGQAEVDNRQLLTHTLQG